MQSASSLADTEATLELRDSDHTPPGAHPARSGAWVGRTLGDRFFVHTLVEIGESGDLYAATDTHAAPSLSPPVVVIKIAHTAGDHRVGEAFRLEYNQARRLSNPNIPRVHDFITDSDTYGYTLELPPGSLLVDRLPKRLTERLSRDYAWAVITGVGAALVHAHMRDVIHGSLSMRSIWLTEDRQLSVLDFGSRPPVAEAWSGETALPMPCSTEVARYASCEVLAGLEPGVSDDLYSLSCLAYELLSGRHPWDGESATSARDRESRLVRPPGLKSAVWRTLKAGLSLSPDQRPNSVSDWLAALNLAINHERLPVMALTSVARTGISRRESAIGVTALSILGFCLSVGHFAPHEVPTPTSLAANTTSAATALPRQAAGAPLTQAAGAPPSRETSQASSPTPAPAPAPTHPLVAAAHEPAKSAPIAPRPLPIGGGLWFSQAHYTVAPQSRFVEVRVLRRGSTKDAQFEWWTEAGTALEGVNFHGQAPAIQAIKAGTPATSFFIRVPESKVTHRSFKVCVKQDPSAGTPASACAKIFV